MSYKHFCLLHILTAHGSCKTIFELFELLRPTVNDCVSGDDAFDLNTSRLNGDVTVFIDAAGLAMFCVVRLEHKLR